eukprot:9191763-Heterocapsa_arctica.AAC.1
MLSHWAPTELRILRQTPELELDPKFRRGTKDQYICTHEMATGIACEHAAVETSDVPWTI